MGKAKFTKETSEKLTFTITDIDKENGIFTYLDEDGEEEQGKLCNIFKDVKLPFDITLKASEKENLEVRFETETEQ